MAGSLAVGGPSRKDDVVLGIQSLPGDYLRAGPFREEARPACDGSQLVAGGGHDHQKRCCVLYFAKLSRRRLKRGVFKSVDDLQSAINQFIAETNPDLKPFVWTADPDKIIAAVKRGHQMLDSIHWTQCESYLLKGSNSSNPSLSMSNPSLREVRIARRCLSAVSPEGVHVTPVMVFAVLRTLPSSDAVSTGSLVTDLAAAAGTSRTLSLPFRLLVKIIARAIEQDELPNVPAR